jgi:class 3 adenylate cyclase/ketosteroid isomerase-like protein
MVCSSCGYDGRAGARFCEGCGVGLSQPCASCGAELSAAARFCGACGAAVGAPPVVAARKVVSVVFGDLVGSTALQETLDPESARRVMARFYEVMRAVIARHDGRLDKFVGDGVVAVFGVPAAGEDDALRAVRCATAMVADLAVLGAELERDWGVRLAMRTGVNTGELVIGEEGELVGDAMNTGARLEQAAAPGEVLIGQATWRLVRRRVQLEPVEPLTLKGKAEPVRAWRVLAVVPGPDEPARVDAPLIGRAGELAKLRAALGDAIAARCCRLVTVIGSPGMGKTRLADEFALAVARDATVVQGRCEPTGEGITFGPVAELLRGAGGIGESDPPDTVRAKLAALVEGEPDADRIVARAGSLLGVADPASAEETFWGCDRPSERLIRDAFRRFARRDFDGLIDLYADDYVMVDHRGLGWTEVDREGVRGIADSMPATTLDVRLDVDEVPPTGTVPCRVHPLHRRRRRRRAGRAVRPGLRAGRSPHPGLGGDARRHAPGVRVVLRYRIGPAVRRRRSGGLRRPGHRVLGGVPRNAPRRWRGVRDRLRLGSGDRGGFVPPLRPLRAR